MLTPSEIGILPENVYGQEFLFVLEAPHKADPDPDPENFTALLEKPDVILPNEVPKLLEAAEEKAKAEREAKAADKAAAKQAREEKRQEKAAAKEEAQKNKEVLKQAKAELAKAKRELRELQPRKVAKTVGDAVAGDGGGGGDGGDGGGDGGDGHGHEEKKKKQKDCLRLL